MKKTLLALLLLFVTLGVAAQVPEAARWSSSVKMTSATEGVIKMKMSVADGWHVYGTDLPKGGPVAMTFDFGGSKGITFVGKPQPSVSPTVVDDPSFGMALPYWSGTVVFEQKFKVTDRSAASIAGSVRFQGCNGEMCAPPKTKKINLSIPKTTE